MTREIKIVAPSRTPGDLRCYETRSFVFNGGEVQVQIPNLPELDGNVAVLARVQSSDDLMRLVLATDILDRQHTGRRRLIIPYFPYARQDRVMQPGEAFSLRAVARIINDLDYDEVFICDPHSDVTPALLNKVRVISQLEMIQNHATLRKLLVDVSPIVIAPDAGAAKKAYKVAQYFGCELLTATKVRDVQTGEITGTRVADPDVQICNDPCLIVDDICDGGRTFIELAKVLREQGANRVYLYVTHGIFSKGLRVFDGLIDGIFTTDSFLPNDVLDDRNLPVSVSSIHDVHQKGLV